jgi:hypothetical protein
MGEVIAGPLDTSHPLIRLPTGDHRYSFARPLQQGLESGAVGYVTKVAERIAYTLSKDSVVTSGI